MQWHYHSHKSERKQISYQRSGKKSSQQKEISRQRKLELDGMVHEKVIKSTTDMKKKSKSCKWVTEGMLIQALFIYTVGVLGFEKCQHIFVFSHLCRPSHFYYLLVFIRFITI